MGNRLEFPEVALGLAQAGLVMVPLNPRMSAPEAEFILRHCHAEAIVLDETYAAVVASYIDETRPVVISLGGSEVGRAYEEELQEASPRDLGAVVPEIEPFVIAYTSGTSGRPKGVMISHRSRCLTFSCIAAEVGLHPGSRTVAVAPLYYGAGFAWAFAALYTGGSIAVMPEFEPEQLLRTLDDARAQGVFLVPTHAHMIRELPETVRRSYKLAELRHFYFNAAPMPQELKIWVASEFPHVGFYEFYGSTEAGNVTALRPEDQLRKLNCAGPPWQLTEVRLIGADGMPVDGPGTGQLFSRSPFLMNGYLDDPAATSAATTADGFFTAGDIANVDEEGYLYIVGRADDMIITGGMNVFPRDVEGAILRHGGVAEVAVVGLSSEKWGQEVCAFVVPRKGEHLDAASLDAHCRRELAAYKVPKRYELLEQLPRNSGGKVLLRELRARFASVKETARSDR